MYKKILNELKIFNKERDWEQFHSPKNLVMTLGSEVGELLDIFRFLTEQDSFRPENIEDVKDELGDVFLVLLNLAYNLNIDLLSAAENKLDKLRSKYPVEIAKGLAKKHTEYNQELRN